MPLYDHITLCLGKHESNIILLNVQTCAFTFFSDLIFCWRSLLCLWRESIAWSCVQCLSDAEQMLPKPSAWSAIWLYLKQKYFPHCLYLQLLLIIFMYLFKDMHTRKVSLYVYSKLKCIYNKVCFIIIYLLMLVFQSTFISWCHFTGPGRLRPSSLVRVTHFLFTISVSQFYSSVIHKDPTFILASSCWPEAELLLSRLCTPMQGCVMMAIRKIDIGNNNALTLV